MKKISSFFSTATPVNKKAKISEDIPIDIRETTASVAVTGVGPSNSELGEQSQTNNDWPTCWTLVQKNDFCLSHEWLCVRNQKLGCTPFGKVGCA